LTSLKRLAVPLEGRSTPQQGQFLEEYSMTRRLVFWLAAFFLTSFTAQAQDKVELFGGFASLAL
jgi:hypothetical protein